MEYVSENYAQMKSYVRDTLGYKSVPEATFNTYMNAISATAAISLAPFALLFIIPISNNQSEGNRRILRLFLSLAAGGLLGDAFLHLLPHAIIAANQGGKLEHKHGVAGAIKDRLPQVHLPNDHSFEENIIKVSVCALAGIFSFLFIEFVIRLLSAGRGGGHQHGNGGGSRASVAAKSGKGGSAQQQQPSSQVQLLKNKADKAVSSAVTSLRDNVPTPIATAAYLNLAADFLHNFTDGLAIGASFLAGEKIGFATTFMVLLHEIPHEIGDFALLVESGYSKWKAIALQLLTAIGAVSGCALALLASKELGSKANLVIIPFTAGGFIYVALVSIVSELMHNVRSVKQSFAELVMFVAGFGLMMVILALEVTSHHHH